MVDEALPREAGEVAKAMPKDQVRLMRLPPLVDGNQIASSVKRERYEPAKPRLTFENQVGRAFVNR